MKEESSRIRLDIGAVTASEHNNRNFLFLLYQEDGSKCLAVPLTPSDMHAVLTNITTGSSNSTTNSSRPNTSDASAPESISGAASINPPKTIYRVLMERMALSGTELLEVEIVSGSSNGTFQSLLRFTDGEIQASFSDGIIMAKLCLAPIYIEKELMNQNAIYTGTDTISLLKKELQKAVSREDYEEAYLIQQRLERMNSH